MNDYDEEGNLKDDDGEPILKKKRMLKRELAKPTVSSRFKGINPNHVDKISEIFIGKEFCVIVGTEKNPKSFIEKKIMECGGETVQNPGVNTFCILTSKKIHKVNAYIKKVVFKGITFFLRFIY